MAWFRIVLFLPLLAGCGSSGGDSAHGAATSTSTPTPTATVVVSATPTTSPARAFAVGSTADARGTGLDASAIIRSDDGGGNWDVVASFTQRVHALTFIDAKTGWIAGERTIERSDDGGISWTPQIARTSEYRDVSFASRTRGIAAGRIVDFVGAAELLATVDGQRWAVLDRPESPVFRRGNLERACIDESGDGIAVGSVDESRVVVGIRGNSASEISDRFPRASLAVVACAGAHDLWLAGRQRALLHSTDGGTTWRDVSAPIADLFEGDVEALDFVDEQTGWLAANARGVGGPVVLHTIDRGATWTRQTLPAIGTAVIRALDFGTRRDGMLALEVGDGAARSPEVLVTSDGGVNWQRHTLPALRTVEDVSVVP